MYVNSPYGVRSIVRRRLRQQTVLDADKLLLSLRPVVLLLLGLLLRRCALTARCLTHWNHYSRQGGCPTCPAHPRSDSLRGQSVLTWSGRLSVERHRQPRIDRQQMVSSLQKTVNVFLQLEVLRLELMKTGQQGSDCKVLTFKFFIFFKLSPKRCCLVLQFDFRALLPTVY